MSEYDTPCTCEDFGPCARHVVLLRSDLEASERDLATLRAANERAVGLLDAWLVWSGHARDCKCDGHTKTRAFLAPTPPPSQGAPTPKCETVDPDGDAYPCKLESGHLGAHASVDKACGALVQWTAAAPQGEGEATRADELNDGEFECSVEPREPGHPLTPSSKP